MSYTFVLFKYIELILELVIYIININKLNNIKFILELVIYII